MKGRRLLFRFFALWRLAAAVAIVFAVNVLAARWSRDASLSWLPWRVDLTQNRLFTFHPKTREMLANLDEIVHVVFYNTGRWPLDLQAEEERIRDLMAELARESRGKVIFEEVDPFAGLNGNAEKMAEAARGVEQSGVRGRVYASADPLKGTQQGYFSLRVECGARQEIIHAPDTERSLEYRLMAAINKLTRPRKKVAVLAPNPKSTIETDFPRFFQEITEYADAVKVMPVKANSYRVRSDADALVVLSPRLIDDDTLVSINRHVLSGKPLVAVMDGLVPMTQTTFVPNSSKLLEMLEHWGVEVLQAMVYEKASNLVLTDIAQPSPGRVVPVENYYKFRAVRKNFDPKSPLTRGVNDAEFYYATPLEKAEVVPPGVAVRPLVWTSPTSGRDGGEENRFVSPFPDPRRQFDPDKFAPQTLIMEAEGTFPSYQPETRAEDALDIAAGEMGSGDQEKRLGLDAGASDVSPPGTRVVVVGGSHFLRNENNAGGYALLHNILEQLTYDSSLSELRSQRHVSRTLRRDLNEERERAIRLAGLLATPAAALIAGLGAALGRKALRRRRARRLMAGSGA